MTQANYSPENISDDEDRGGFRRKARNNFNYIQLALNGIQSWVAKALDEVRASIIKPAIRGGFLIHDVRYFGTLANAIAHVPTGSAQTLFITNPQTLKANLTVPSYISLVVLKGGSIGGAYTLTINGPFEAGRFQAFDTSITVTWGMGALPVVIPHWWGANGNELTNDTAALQAALNALSRSSNMGQGEGGGAMYLPAGIYLSGELLVETAFVSIYGDGPTASEIRTTGSGTSLLKFYGGSGIGIVRNFEAYVRDLKITHASGTWGALLHLENISEMRLEFLWIEAGAGVTSSVRTESALLYTIEQCLIRGGQYGLNVSKRVPGIANGDAYPNNININNTLVKSAEIWGIWYRDGELFKVNGCSIEANSTTTDANHGGIFIDSSGAEVGQGPCAIIERTWFEANRGVHIRIAQHAYAPGGTIVRACSGAGSGCLYGVYGNVTSPDIGKVTIIDSGFNNASGGDYYFANNFNATILRSTAMTASLGPQVIAIPTPTDSSQSQIVAGWLAYSPQYFNTNGQTSLAISQGGPPIVVAHTSGTNIATLTGGKDGNTAIIYSQTGNTTFRHRASGIFGTTDEIEFPGGLDYKPVTGETMHLLRAFGHWHPVGPPQNLSTTSSPTFTNLALTGRLNINGATDAVNSWINVLGPGNINISASGTVRCFGVGNPASSNNEYIFLQHNGTSGHIYITKDGAGTYRPFRLYTSDLQRYECAASGSHVFATPVLTQSTLEVQGNLTVTDHFISSSANFNVRFSTSDGNDNGRLNLSAGGADNGDTTRGAYLTLRGNENAVPGHARLSAGNISGGSVILATGNDVARLTIDETGLATFSGTLNGAAANFSGVVALTDQLTLTKAQAELFMTSSLAANPAFIKFTANGAIGHIGKEGTAGTDFMTGGTAGALQIATATNVPVEIGVNGARAAKFASTGPTFDSNNIIITTAKTPSSASDTGTTGMMAWDSSYVYVCVATDTWKRSALATW